MSDKNLRPLQGEGHVPMIGESGELSYGPLPHSRGITITCLLIIRTGGTTPLWETRWHPLETTQIQPNKGLRAGVLSSIELSWSSLRQQSVMQSPGSCCHTSGIHVVVEDGDLPSELSNSVLLWYMLSGQIRDGGYLNEN